jgi:hypothetical protein
MTELPSAAEMRAVIRYEPDTGRFFWLTPPSRAATKGGEAGWPDFQGYRRIRYKGRGIRAHRLAWLLVYGEWPGHLDHINGDRSDNRIANLRECTLAENRQNASLRNDNTTGYCGVHLDRKKGTYYAVIRIHGKAHYLGRGFSTAEEAAAAYADGKRRLHTFSPEVRARPP